MSSSITAPAVAPLSRSDAWELIIRLPEDLARHTIKLLSPRMRRLLHCTCIMMRKLTADTVTCARVASNDVSELSHFHQTFPMLRSLDLGSASRNPRPRPPDLPDVALTNPLCGVLVQQLDLPLGQQLTELALRLQLRPTLPLQQRSDAGGVLAPSYFSQLAAACGRMPRLQRLQLAAAGAVGEPEAYADSPAAAAPSTGLTSLELHGVPLPPLLLPLEQLRALHRLRITASVDSTLHTVALFPALAQLPSLQQLDIETADGQLTANGVALLSALSGLRYVRLTAGWLDDESIRGLAALTQLTALGVNELMSSSISEHGWHLITLRSLRRLEVRAAAVEPAAELLMLPALTHISWPAMMAGPPVPVSSRVRSLDYCQAVGFGAEDNLGFARLQVAGLTRLVVRWHAVKAADLAAVAGQTGLRSLRLSCLSRDVTDAAFSSSIAHLTNLRDLWVGKAENVTDKGLTRALQQLTHLTSLRIASFKSITDAGMLVIVHLPRLWQLGWAGNPGVTLGLMAALVAVGGPTMERELSHYFADPVAEPGCQALLDIWRDKLPRLKKLSANHHSMTIGNILSGGDGFQFSLDNVF